MRAIGVDKSEWENEKREIERERERERERFEKKTDEYNVIM